MIPSFASEVIKPWGKNTIKFDGKHVTDAITDLSHLIG